MTNRVQWSRSRPLTTCRTTKLLSATRPTLSPADGVEYRAFAKPTAYPGTQFGSSSTCQEYLIVSAGYRRLRNDGYYGRAVPVDPTGTGTHLDN